VSPGHFARRFKREMGMTFVDYRAQLRLDRFFELSNQAEGRANLVDLAQAAGFGSYSQFHRVYTRLLGESPRAFRRRASPGRG
jgi:AraC family transcriptional regulator